MSRCLNLTSSNMDGWEPSPSGKVTISSQNLKFGDLNTEILVCRVLISDVSQNSDESTQHTDTTNSRSLGDTVFPTDDFCPRARVLLLAMSSSLRPQVLLLQMVTSSEVNEGACSGCSSSWADVMGICFLQDLPNMPGWFYEAHLNPPIHKHLFSA